MHVIATDLTRQIAGGGGNDFGQNAENAPALMTKIYGGDWTPPPPPPPKPPTSDGTFWGDYWYYLQTGW